MAGTPQTMNSPPRNRDGPWGYSYEYENSPHYSHHNGPGAGPPGGYYGGAKQGMYGGPPPSSGPPTNHPNFPPPSQPHAPPRTHPGEYWSYDYPSARNTGGYWGPPPSYDSYHHPPGMDRHMPPPARGPRLPPRLDEQPPAPHLRVPPSPRPRLGRGVDPSQNRGDFMPPPPSTDGIPKKKGDPLSILANVSAGMTGKDGQKQKQQQQTQHLNPMPAPTSPLQRRTRPSPITPNTNSPNVNHRTQRQLITPTGSSRPLDRPASWDYGPESGYMERPHGHGYHSARRGHPGPEYSPRPPDGSPPALVERGSFDSQGDAQYRERPPPNSYYYDDRGYGYWEGAPPAYPPPRYNHYDWYEGQEDPYGHHRQPPPVAPYTLVQQPRLEEKTILRKKFSWKHYPELERFLIANRDEYLKHSSMNYTAEQKQFNNWLTESLLEVAGRHNYMFDPDDFNFVAIRDRIRCYYKSYVQTARKRGLKLPEKKKD